MYMYMYTCIYVHIYIYILVGHMLPSGSKKCCRTRRKQACHGWQQTMEFFSLFRGLCLSERQAVHSSKR